MNFHKNIFGFKEHGYVTLISVLIVGAVVVAVAVSLLLLGINSSRTSFALEQSVEARVLASTCAEKAMQIIHDAPAFSGSGNLTLGQGSCQYEVTNLGGEYRDIESIATVGTIVRKVNVEISQITPRIIVSEWHEVASF